MLTLFGNPSTDETKNSRFRREKLDVSVIETESKPFVMFVFIPSGGKTKNHLVNQGLLELDIVCSTQYEAELIYNRINELLKANYDNFNILVEGQISSGISGVYMYRVRYSPLVKS